MLNRVMQLERNQAEDRKKAEQAKARGKVSLGLRIKSALPCFRISPAGEPETAEDLMSAKGKNLNAKEAMERLHRFVRTSLQTSHTRVTFFAQTNQV